VSDGEIKIRTDVEEGYKEKVCVVCEFGNEESNVEIKQKSWEITQTKA
jgi:hypothetical protein